MEKQEKEAVDENMKERGREKGEREVRIWSEMCGTRESERSSNKMVRLRKTEREK